MQLPHTRERHPRPKPRVPYSERVEPQPDRYFALFSVNARTICTTPMIAIETPTRIHSVTAAAIGVTMSTMPAMMLTMP